TPDHRVDQWERRYMICEDKLLHPLVRYDAGTMTNDDLVTLVFGKVLSSIFASVGIITNFISIIVLCKPKMRSSTNTYLRAIAVADLLFCIAHFPMSLRMYEQFSRSYGFMIAYVVFCWFHDLCSSIVAWLTTAFTIERFIVIRYPMVVKKFIKTSTANWIALTILVICCAVTSGNYAQFMICIYPFFQKNATFRSLNLPTCGNDSDQRAFTMQKRNNTDEKYWEPFYTSFSIFVPLILLMIFNAFLIKILFTRKVTSYTSTSHSTIRDMNSQWSSTAPNNELVSIVSSNKFTQEGMLQKPICLRFKRGPNDSLIRASGSKNIDSSKQSIRRTGSGPMIRQNTEKNRITLMLILIVISFMLLNVPSGLALVYKPWNINASIIYFLNIVNATLNFFFYSFFSLRFRRTFVQTFAPCHRGK
ncbi:hypothetical protein Ciccas_007263, partial [Cichlidogyrus casuarinus]